MFKQSWIGKLAAIRLALACSWAVTGCVTPTGEGSGASWPPITAEIRIGIGGARSTDLTGEIAPGKCIRITYSGSDGAVLQTSTVSVPSSVQVPAGAVRQQFDIVDCPDGAGPGSNPASSGSGVALAGPTGGRWTEVFSYPIVANELFLGGPICHARVLCSPGQLPYDSIAHLLAAGPGTPVPPNVDVRFFADAVVDVSGATIRFSARDAITGLRFDWNGLAAFADLNAGINALPRSLPNGWTSVESRIDRTDLNDIATEWNRGKVTIRTLSVAKPQTYELGFQNG